MSGVPSSPPPPPPPPQMPVVPSYQPVPSRPRGLSALKAIGYFVVGTFWFVLNGTPVAPVGLLALLGLLTEKKKAAMALIVLAGCVLGGIGTGVNLRFTTEPPSVDIGFSVGLHPTFNRMILERRFGRIGLLDEGRALADTAIEAIRAGDRQAFTSCFDPRDLDSAEGIDQFLRDFVEKVGSIKSFRQVDAGMMWFPPLNKSIYVLWYKVETSKADAVRVRIGLDKTPEGWKLLSIHFWLV
jgi:hypothetical protein